MPTTVTCPSCKKMLKVRDELVGKKLKCPGCGNTFDAKAGGGGPVAAGKGGTRFDPTKAKKPSEKGPKVAISGGLIMMIAGILAVPAVVLAIVFGPVRVKHQWDDMDGKARDSVTDVLTFALKAHLSTSGDWNPNKPGHDPRVMDDVTFVVPFMSMSMPEWIQFFGQSSEGEYKGRYNTKNGEIEADMDLGAVVVLPGVPVPKRKTGDTPKIHVTGRGNGNATTAEVDGKKATIFYPPKLDE
jgi:hypothetical protein